MSDYSITLKAPNATRPTVAQLLSLYDVCIGPKRTIRRRRSGFNDTLSVPELSTWTLDTLRIVLHQLATFLPDGRESTPVMAEIADRGQDHICIRVWYAITERHRVEAAFSVPKKELSDPMRAAIVALPNRPLRLSLIAEPESQGEADMPCDLRLDDIERLHRITDRVKEIAGVDPSVLRAFDTLLDAAWKRLGLDDR